MKVELRSGVPDDTEVVGYELTAAVDAGLLVDHLDVIAHRVSRQEDLGCRSASISPASRAPSVSTTTAAHRPSCWATPVVHHPRR